MDTKQIIIPLDEWERTQLELETLRRVQSQNKITIHEFTHTQHGGYYHVGPFYPHDPTVTYLGKDEAIQKLTKDLELSMQEAQDFYQTNQELKRKIVRLQHRTLLERIKNKPVK